MKLALYIARLGWTSLFILFWLRTFDFLTEKPELTVSSFIVFGGIAIISTFTYAWLIYKVWPYNKGGIKG